MSVKPSARGDVTEPFVGQRMFSASLKGQIRYFEEIKDLMFKLFHLDLFI